MIPASDKPVAISDETFLAYVYPDRINLDGSCRPIIPIDLSEGNDD